MINIKIIFPNDNIIYTSINCTLEEAEEYYLNNWFNPTQKENKPLVKALKVELIKEVL